MALIVTPPACDQHNGTLLQIWHSQHANNHRFSLVPLSILLKFTFYIKTGLSERYKCLLQWKVSNLFTLLLVHQCPSPKEATVLANLNLQPTFKSRISHKNPDSQLVFKRINGTSGNTGPTTHTASIRRHYAAGAPVEGPRVPQGLSIQLPRFIHHCHLACSIIRTLCRALGCRQVCTLWAILWLQSQFSKGGISYRKPGVSWTLGLSHVHGSHLTNTYGALLYFSTASDILCHVC